MDFDGDGQRDVISGSWPGEVYLFPGNKEGGFAKKERVTRSGGDKNVKADKASAVFACDWDRDGDVDLLIGDIRGWVTLFRREAGKKKGSDWGEGEKVKADGRSIKVPGGDAGPCVADWDADGNPDLLVGTDDGSVLFYRNLASKGEPKLAKARTLVAGSPSWGKPAADGHGRRAKICVTDWNEDGRLDLLVGDFASSPSAQKQPRNRRWHGWVWLYLRKGKDGRAAKAPPAGMRSF